MTSPAFEETVAEIRRFAATAKDLASIQEFTVETIAERQPNYNWVGFYMLDPDAENVLVLGPFRGAPTEHVRIPVTEGICGAAVAQGATVIVDDVSADPRYLACSIETKSEIVVPIRANGRIVGEIDIDSHALNAFGPEDRSFLEECAEMVGQFLEKEGGRVSERLRQILGENLPRTVKAERIAEAIREYGAYRWVGLYDVNYQLSLISNIAWSGPSAPAYPSFPITKGLTSRAIAEGKAVNVSEVSNDPSYLTALDSTRSEIIIPVLDNEQGRVVGTLDVESERPHAFDSETQALLEECAQILRGFWV